MIKLCLILAGMGQLALAVASLALPRALSWREDTAKLRPLTREVFWTYAAYIWVTNVCFGLVSSLAPHWLMQSTPLARGVNGYITAYWGARLLIQFFYFGRAGGPSGMFYRVAELFLVLLFAFLTLVYGVLTVTGGGTT